jgi:hypothetical protein
MSQVLTITNVPLNVEHLQHANHPKSNIATGMRPIMEPLQVQDQDLANETAPASAAEGTPRTRQREVPNHQANIIIVQLTATTLLASISSGLMTVCIPRMAIDLEIAPPLYFWYVTVAQLTNMRLVAGCFFAMH